jgi:Holliday junction resolvase RusA-like endonuclease
MLTFSLPVAPTANNAFANRKGGRGYGRIKSKSYRAWIKQADKFYLLQRMGHMVPIYGPYRCEFTFPEKLRGDLDGRIKLILDWMVNRGIVQDDSPELLREFNAKFNGEQGDLMWITLRGIDGRLKHNAEEASA